MDAIQLTFAERLGESGISIDEKQADQFETYYRLLVEWNERMNLTAITEREQVYVKHFLDSLSVSFFVDMSAVGRLADIGSGAGFPGIPLKIVYPHLELTIVDSLQKRIGFLRNLCEELGLERVNCVHARAEDAARSAEYRDRFDVVTARAVARLAVLNEFCLPFVRPGGRFVAMKGSEPQTEIEEAEFSFRELNGRVRAIHTFCLPLEDAVRHLLEIEKTSPTPRKYPRKPGIPIKQPLVR